MAPRKGAWAEEKAAQWLMEQGCRIQARNYTIPGAEIDLIITDGAFTAFVEVKSSEKDSACRIRVTAAKQKRICRAALRFSAENGLLDSPLRFDVVEVTPEGIAWLKNAFPYQAQDSSF